MDLLVFASHNVVSTPTTSLERVAIGGSALKNMTNNYVEEGEAIVAMKSKG
jgi:hypothetical protein